MHIAAAAAKAANADGAALGALGAGGLALAASLFLILGVMGEGKVTLTNNPAMITAFVAGTSFKTAGEIWAHPERLTEQGLTGFGVGTGSGPFGDVGVGAVCLVLLILMLCWKLTPVRGATLGMIAAFVWPTAGPDTIWGIPTDLAAGALVMAGG